jgi:hypothetical protein
MNWNWSTWNWGTFSENLGTIKHALVAFGPRIFVGILILIGTIALGKLMKAWAASRRKAPEKPPGVKFLEEAMEDDAPRKPVPGYTYADFKRDLYDRGLTFNEIYEKCGGVFPKKPEGKEAETEAPKPEGPGSKSDDPERLAKLQAWFQETGKERLKGLVRPPPNPYPIVYKIYTRGRR